MDPFPFTIIKHHKTYKVTFLQSVTFKIEYDSTKESFESFRDFFEQRFGIQLSLTQYNVKNADALRYKSKDGFLRMKWAKGFIEYGVEGRGYKNFKTSLLPFINEICGFLKDVESSVSGFSIGMIDIWPLVGEYAIEPSEFISVIFSQDMLEFGEYHKSEGKGFIDINPSDDKMNLLIKYLYIPKTKENKKLPCRLVLDTKCSYQGDAISADNVSEITQSFSDILYSAYHWCVTPEVLKSME